jgi:hypothetical protein
LKKHTNPRYSGYTTTKCFRSGWQLNLERFGLLGKPGVENQHSQSIFLTTLLLKNARTAPSYQLFLQRSRKQAPEIRAGVSAHASIPDIGTKTLTIEPYCPGISAEKGRKASIRMATEYSQRGPDLHSWQRQSRFNLSPH